MTNLEAENFGLSTSGSFSSFVSGVSSFSAPLVNLEATLGETYFCMLILKGPVMVGGGCGLGGCWVGRGGERRSEEEEAGRACSGSGMASVLEDGFRSPEEAWGLREKEKFMILF